MYDLILNMMEERGLDATFATELTNFATSYEHREYISFLERLKKFVSC
jgi:complement component 1 Q subcomponent-binding protein